MSVIALSRAVMDAAERHREFIVLLTARAPTAKSSSTVMIELAPCSAISPPAGWSAILRQHRQHRLRENAGVGAADE